VHVPLLHDISVADDGEKEPLRLKPSLVLPEFEKAKVKEQEGFIVIVWAEPSEAKVDGLGEQPLIVTVADEAELLMVILIGWLTLTTGMLY
jgi:hypothetical protein